MNALALLLLIPSAPINEKPKPPPTEIEKLQGVWVMKSMELRGAEAPLPRTAAPDRYTLVIVGDAYVFYTQGGKIKVDAAKKSADLSITEGRYKGRDLPDVPGLYELKGDTLKLAIRPPLQAGDRPTDLKTDANTVHTLYTFERDVKATKEQAAEKLKELTASLAPARGGVGPGGARTNAATQEMLRQIVEKLDRIEKRLDALEKKK